MTPTPKTIQIFLPGGDPRGVRVAEITTRIVQVIEVPRSLLQDFLKMPESDQVAVYFLFGNAEEGEDPQVYIGQTGDLRSRLAKHNADKNKDFWTRAAVLISRTNSLTQTHALYLEWHCLQVAQKAARYRLENGTAGTRPHTPAPLAADCHEIFDTGHALLATLGFPVFDPVAGGTMASEPLFHCTGAGAKGTGLYTPDGFVVQKGSIGRLQNVPSIVGTAMERMRQRLLDSAVARAQGDTMIFQRDHLFRSPSSAAIALLGRTANGWVTWKTADGETLDELKRPPEPQS